MDIGRKSLVAAVVFFVGVISSPAYSILIDGSIGISGGMVPADGATLDSSTGIDFLEWNGSSYVSGTSGGSFTASSVSGDFASYITPSPFILGSINDFNFNPLSEPLPYLWSLGGFSFDLQSVDIDVQNNSNLVLSGTGKLYGNGFETTLSTFDLSVYSYGSTYSWSAIITTDPTIADAPSPSTLLLLMSGLIGLGFFRRFKN